MWSIGGGSENLLRHRWEGPAASQRLFLSRQLFGSLPPSLIIYTVCIYTTLLLEKTRAAQRPDSRMVTAYAA